MDPLKTSFLCLRCLGLTAEFLLLLITEFWLLQKQESKLYSEIAIFPTLKKTLQALHPGHLWACLSPNIRSILGGQAQRASS